MTRWWEWQIIAGSAVGHFVSHGVVAVQVGGRVYDLIFPCRVNYVLYLTVYPMQQRSVSADLCASLQAYWDLNHAVFLLHPFFCFLAPRHVQWWEQRFGEGPPCCTLSQPSEACWFVVMTYICGKSRNSNGLTSCLWHVVEVLAVRSATLVQIEISQQPLDELPWNCWQSQAE